MYEFMGTVKAVGEIQTFASGFQKRELVVEEPGKVRYFADLTALRLEVLDGAAVPPPAEPEDQSSFVAPEDEPPF